MAQQSAFLESVTKFKITNPKAKNIFDEKEFFQWSDKNFYRTSSNDMSSKVTPISPQPNLSRPPSLASPLSSPATRATSLASRSTTTTWARR